MLIGTKRPDECVGVDKFLNRGIGARPVVEVMAVILMGGVQY